MYGSGYLPTLNPGLTDMAGPRNQRDALDVPSPALDVQSPEGRDRDHPDSWTLQAVMGIKETQGATTEAIKNLGASVSRMENHLLKFDDLRVEVGKLDTRLASLQSDFDKADRKLESLRIWVIGAAAIVGFIAFATPIVLRLFPQETHAAAQQSAGEATKPTH